MSNTNTGVPAIDVTPDNPFVVETPTSFDLPQVNPYCGNLTPEQICILIAGFQALAGTNLSPSTLLTNTENYVNPAGGFSQEYQVPGLIYTLLAILTALPSINEGLVFTGNYGGLAPPFTPLSYVAIAIDSQTNQQWVYLSPAIAAPGMGGWQ